jgi:mannose-6-phosphate isomerase-like protein (cupin superfamily)
MSSIVSPVDRDRFAEPHLPNRYYVLCSSTRNQNVIRFTMSASGCDRQGVIGCHGVADIMGRGIPYPGWSRSQRRTTHHSRLPGAAGFGPPRHLHQRDDEVIEVVEGQVVAWTPERSLVLAPGDLVLLPKPVPHTWRAYGAEPIRFTVTFTPSGFERFFPDIERLGLVITDVPELTSVAGDAGMEILGPPLSDEEVRQIIAEAGAS